MKIIIIIVLLILFILYYKKSKCLDEHLKFSKEKFDSISYFDNMSPFEIQDVEKVGPFYIDGKSMIGTPNDPANSNIYKDKQWEMKSGFSDIFNDNESNVGVINPEKFYNIPIQKIINENSLIPSVKSTDKFPSEFEFNKSTYKLLGFAINQYYEQYYLIYEHMIEDVDKNPTVNNDLKFLNYKLYEYTLVKMKGKVPHILHEIGPREKININDFVYLSLGVFQLGPFHITQPVMK